MKAAQAKMQVSWARKKPQNHTTQKKKEKKIERKQRETKVKNVIVPVLVFLFSVFVFALFFSLPILWRRFSPQLANNDSHFFGEKVRLEFLKFGLWKSVVISPNCGQITKNFSLKSLTGQEISSDEKRRRRREKKENKKSVLHSLFLYCLLWG